MRTAITLGAMLPDMRLQADALAGDLADLVRVRKTIVGENEHLSRDLDLLGREQLRLNVLIDERQSKQAATEQALEAERSRAADLARQVDSLKDLIAKLESGLDSADPHGACSRLARSRKTQRAPILPRSRIPGRLAPAVAFAATRGHLRLPVNGVKIREFGGSDGRRWNAKGHFDWHPCRRADHISVRRLGSLRRHVSQLWATLDPECRWRVSCATSGDGADFRRSRPVCTDR